MKFDDFKVACFVQGIDPRLIDSCENFVKKHDFYFDMSKKTAQNRNVKNDLGYAELSDIDTVAEGFKAMKNSIFMQTCDYDSRGRSLQKKKLNQMIKDPGKGFQRVVLKTFYLIDGTI